jgi:RNA polymerase sigma-70 factor, ECF subfamily
MLLSKDPIMDEEITVRAAISGDPEAFTEIFQRYYPMIYSYAYRLCLNQTDAQDIAQDTFIKAAGALSSYRPESAFRNWLYQICTNTTRDWQRRSGRLKRIEEIAEERVQLASTERLADHDRACEALAALPPDLRSAVVLIYLEGMNHAEAAALLGCAETTVSWRIFRAKRKMKAFLL